MKRILSSLIIVFTSLITTSFTDKYSNSISIPKQDIKELELTKENFFLVCKIYEVKFPEIVYAQARLESGNFKSKLFHTKNNFLGLYNSRIKDFYEFSHWTDCIKGYKTLLQFKYTGSDDYESYYKFLKELPYAMDPNYIQKIRKLSGV